MTRAFVLTNHKGGVGKSTSATNIALGIAGLLRQAGAKNPRVLLVDTDSQSHATLVTTGRDDFDTTNSLYMGFGTGIVAQGTGIFLQNRGAGFSLDPDHPNALAGGKRPYHTIIPGMALKDGDLWAAFGVMGGFMQPQGHFQVISAMLDDDLNPQEALDRPRWYLVGGLADSALALEEGIPVKTMARLAELGHHVRPVAGRGRSIFGSGQIIRRDAATGVLYGGSDPRKDGLVAAY